MVHCERDVQKRAAFALQPPHHHHPPIIWSLIFLKKKEENIRLYKILYPCILSNNMFFCLLMRSICAAATRKRSLFWGWLLHVWAGGVHHPKEKNNSCKAILTNCKRVTYWRQHSTNITKKKTKWKTTEATFSFGPNICSKTEPHSEPTENTN